LGEKQRTAADNCHDKQLWKNRYFDQRWTTATGDMADSVSANYYTHTFDKYEYFQT
jgi:hypothetical protein